MQSSRANPQGITRRRFLETTAAATAASLVAPAVATETKTDSQIVLGSGDFQYEVLHDWAKLPDEFTWQTTHNVALDRDGFLYVIHEGHADKPDHPAIFVFDPHGEYVRSFGSEFQGGGHGLEVREEDGQQFLYVTAYQQLKMFAKLDLKGEAVWTQRAPMQAGVYAEGEDTRPQKVWGRDRFMPTNFAFHPTDGGFYLADGYGSWYIHRYDKDGKWQSSFGGEGKEDGKFNLPHGVWIDDRGEGEPTVVVADRANGRLQWFSLEGEHQHTLDGFLLPANVDVLDDVMLVPDLKARVTLLDAQNKVIAHLGEDPAWREEVLKDEMKLRRQPERWQAGRFVHPHDACFGPNGDIFVAEWVATGRVTKLRRLG